MRPSNRELVREEAEPGGSLAAAALRRATIRLADPEHVHALGGLAAASVRARPADRVLGARLHVVAPPGPDDLPVAATHRLDLEVARPASGDRVLVGGLPDALEEHPARAGALRLQPQPARAGRARSEPPPELPPELDSDAPGPPLPPLDALVTPPPELGSLGSCADAAPAVAHRIAVIAAATTSVAGRPPGAPGSTRASHPFLALALKIQTPLSRAYGVSCRARAERAALRTAVRFAPGGCAPLGPPLPGAWGTGDSASFIKASLQTKRGKVTDRPATRWPRRPRRHTLRPAAPLSGES